MSFDTPIPLQKLSPGYLGPGKSCPLPTPGNLPLLGQYLTSYWEQKKLMAPGCEPLAVQRMMDVLAPYAYGQSLAGAGGGGFLYLLTKEPRQKEALEAVLAKAEVCAAVRVGSWLSEMPNCGLMVLLALYQSSLQKAWELSKALSTPSVLSRASATTVSTWWKWTLRA